MSAQAATARLETVRVLRRGRPRDRVLAWTAYALAALALWAWLSGTIDVGDLLQQRRRDNLVRYVTYEVLPRPLQKDGFSWGGLATWASEVWIDRGLRATLATLWISVAAIVLSGLFALLVAPLAARTLARAEPFLLGDDERGRGWRALSGATRTLCVGLRAIPEYVWAYLLVALIGTSAWPAVLALAIHNGGILGRLFGDTAENVDAGSLRSLRMLGTPRRGIYLFGVLPEALPRLLSYFFYRFESCVREATIMGFLGVVSLGYYINKARARDDDAELILLVACGAVIVLAADLLSYLARRYVRAAR